MSSPAGFRRRVAYDFITDFVISVLNDDAEYMERKAKLTVLPAIVATLLEKIPETNRFRRAVEKCIMYYRAMGIELPELGDKKIVEWFMEVLSRGREETDVEYMRKIATATSCVLAYACIEEAVIPTVEPSMY